MVHYIKSIAGEARHPGLVIGWGNTLADAIEVGRAGGWFDGIDNPEDGHHFTAHTADSWEGVCAELYGNLEEFGV